MQVLLALLASAGIIFILADRPSSKEFILAFELAFSRFAFGRVTFYRDKK